jgi:fructosamine-3-kinase
MTGTAELFAALERALVDWGGGFRIERVTPVAGGCIHRCFVLEGGKRRLFAKTNHCSRLDAFTAEADGLAALAAAGIRVPAPLCWGETGETAYLALEHLDLREAGDYAALGRMLALLHSAHGQHYGWARDNYIGSNPQHNRLSDSWITFWREARLEPQLELARRNGFEKLVAEKGRRLSDALPLLLAGHAPAASLLHGDLWSGNAGFLAAGTPVIFDPAVYHGDRETDVAMTELFGGFPEAFYSAYREAAPLDPGYALRKTLYNLYHVLNHANIFGASYGAQAERMIDRLLGEVR